MKAFLAILLLVSSVFAQTITVGSSSFQTMVGWDALEQSGQEWNPATSTYQYPSTEFGQYDDNLFTALLDLGINVLTVEVYMDDETTDSYTSEDHRTAVNDNADANSINTSGFGFQRLEHQMESVVVPYRTALLNATGETLWIVLRIVDYRSAGFQAEDTPNEYAEFVLAMVQHMDATYSIVPNAIDAINEPDQGQNAGEWTATKVADNIVQAKSRLTTAGYSSIQWIAPSYGAGNSASSFWDSMQTANSSVTTSVNYVSHHNYGTLMNQTQRQALRTNAAADGLGNYLNECTVAFGCTADGSVGNLYDELVDTQVSGWMQYVSAFPANGSGADTDDGGKYILINTTTNAATLSNRAKYLKHYFKYVRRGAVRKSVTNSDSNFLGIPFVNTNGTTVVVIKAASSGTVTVDNLPAGTYNRCVSIGNGTSAPSTEHSCAGNATVGAGGSTTITFTGAGTGTVFDIGYLNPSLICRWFYSVKPSGCP